MARTHKTSRKRKAKSGSPRKTAKVFWSGRSQAIRLPREFRLSAREVRIHREGQTLVLEPLTEEVDENGWPKSFWRIFGGVSDDFSVGNRKQPHERPDPLGEG